MLEDVKSMGNLPENMMKQGASAQRFCSIVQFNVLCEDLALDYREGRTGITEHTGEY